MPKRKKKSGKRKRITFNAEEDAAEDEEDIVHLHKELSKTVTYYDPETNKKKTEVYYAPQSSTSKVIQSTDLDTGKTKKVVWFRRARWKRKTLTPSESSSSSQAHKLTPSKSDQQRLFYHPNHRTLSTRESKWRYHLRSSTTPPKGWILIKEIPHRYYRKVTTAVIPTVIPNLRINAVGSTWIIYSVTDIQGIRQYRWMLSEEESPNEEKEIVVGDEDRINGGVKSLVLSTLFRQKRHNPDPSEPSNPTDLWMELMPDAKAELLIQDEIGDRWQEWNAPSVHDVRPSRNAGFFGRKLNPWQAGALCICLFLFFLFLSTLLDSPQQLSLSNNPKRKKPFG